MIESTILKQQLGSMMEKSRMAIAHRSRYGSGPAVSISDTVNASNTNFRADYSSFLDKITPEEKHMMISDNGLHSRAAAAAFRRYQKNKLQDTAKQAQSYNDFLMFDSKSNVMRNHKEFLLEVSKG